MSAGAFSSAIAQVPGTFNPGYTGDIQEPDFPCALVICFANPKGPTAESKCNPPVSWLIDNFIKKFRPWPQCIFKDADNTQVSYGSQPHVDCPAGFTAETVSTGILGMLGGNNYTGVCLRPVPTCKTTGPNAFTSTAAGSACYTYNVYNDYGSIVASYHYEYVIAARGVTNYSMRISNSKYDNTFYFNLGGDGTANLSQSIIYKTNPYTNNGNAYPRFGSNH
ncbi:hypothetical protein BMD20_29640 [Burkholderia multivorans]|nr:hypothetical protein BMD20_29640 [Burkholderia multivorans]KHS10370.1 hypothetical protein BMD22_28185 [Burkholderia multivorans]